MPKVTALMPLYNGITYIKESLESVQAQTFKDWEFIIVNDYGSDDGCADIVRSYAEKDSRIKLVQAEKRLGLAASLNLGLDMAQGEYVARVDVDDPSKPERFAKQIAFMDTHPEICLCSCWQTSVTPSRSYVQKVACEPHELEASMIFGCEISHCGVMLRKHVFDEHKWRYNPAYLGEDYELWTRAMNEGAIMANLPEPLVSHRWGFGNISIAKGESLREEVRQISMRSLAWIGVHISDYDNELFSGWRNEPLDYAKTNPQKFLLQVHTLIVEILERNNIAERYDDTMLRKVLLQRWNWARRCCGLSPSATFTKNSLDEIKQSTPRAKRRHPMKKLLMPLAHLSRRVVRELMKDVITDVDKRIESWTWERFKRIRDIINTLEMKIKEPVYTPFYHGEKIRILFLFQAASFWPSWESFYQECNSDDRFEVIFAFLDELYGDTTQMKSAKDFLTKMNIPYSIYSDLLLETFKPHVFVLQTPYDEYHRKPNVRSNVLKRKGNRLVYVTYGIEIADTENSRKDHFERDVIKNCWRIYTFSPRMKLDYMIYCQNYCAVQSVGHPKFDGLYYRKRFSLSEDVSSIVAGRRIVLWHVHFPKYIPQIDGIKKLATPYLTEYLNFVEYVRNKKELFFIFQPHPKFLDCKAPLDIQAHSIIDQLNQLENVYIDWKDDYRNSLMNADCIITDRSAVMIEAGAIGVPVLYMSNADYYEPMTAAVMPLVESYYQGNSAQDMKSFLERFQKGEDPNKEKREAAFRQCIPFFDGKCAERIKEDIVLSLEAERESSVEAQLQRQTAQLEERLNHLEAQIQRRSEEQERQLCKEIERWTWDRYKRTKNELVSQTFELLHHDNPKKMQDLMSRSPTYDFAFYLDNRFGSIESAQHVLYTVFQFLPHKSVVDFGCGSGTWLWVAQAFGAQDVLGLDGEYVPDGMRMLHGGQFMPCDLERRQELQKKYDLAMSLEVAEHLSRESAAVFVESLCAASDIVLFSAAHPGQGGDGHINEQPVEYWIEKFAVHGYEPIQIQQLFSTDQHIKKWYKDNIILFVTGQICQDIKDAMERVRVGG